MLSRASWDHMGGEGMQGGDPVFLVDMQIDVPGCDAQF